MPQTPTVKRRTRPTRKTATAKKVADSKGEIVAGISDEAVRAKTGKTWAQWCKVLDKDGAKDMPHKDIAALVVEKHGVGPWWSQMVTVGYEQARGLRKKNQTARGWRASASRTVNVPLAALYEAWDDAKIRRRWLGQQGLTLEKKNASKSMRLTWTDETSIDVNFYAKGEAKSQVAVQHGRLKKEADVAKVKRTWAEALASLKAMLEA